MYLASGESHVKNFDATNRRPVNVNWRVLEFGRLLSSALKLSTECHKLRGLFRSVAFRSKAYRGMPTTTLQWTVECQLRGKICPRNATFRAQMCAAEYQGLKMVVWFLAFRGQFKSEAAQSVALDWNTAPAILHQKSPCLKRHIFLQRDF
jgi:hypothetical protein